MGDEQRKKLELDGKSAAWWRRLVDLGAFIAVPPVAAYVLGLIAFWMQLSVAYTFSDAWTTWYATTLASKLLIIGIGLTVIFRALSLSALIAAAALLVAQWRTKEEKKPTYEHEGLPSLLYKYGPACLFMVTANIVLVTFVYQSFNVDFGLRFFIVPIAIIFLSGAYLQFRRRFSWVKSHIKRALSYFSRPYLEAPPLIFLVLVVVFTFYPTGISTPCVTSQRYDNIGDVRGDSILVKTEGRLVGRNDGQWYIFNENGDLVAIPDTESNIMKVSDAFYDSQLPPLISGSVGLIGNGLALLIPGLEASPEQDNSTNAEVESNPSAPASEACF